MPLHHLRTQDGKEIDLQVETQEGYYAFEVKMTVHISQIDALHLLNMEAILNEPLFHSFVLFNNKETHHFSDKATAVHATMFLE